MRHGCQVLGNEMIEPPSKEMRLVSVGCSSNFHPERASCASLAVRPTEPNSKERRAFNAGKMQA